MMRCEGAVDRGPGFGVDRFRQVEAANFGSGVLAEGRDRVRHEVLSIDGDAANLWALPRGVKPR
jgi:hypothetical protein